MWGFLSGPFEKGPDTPKTFNAFTGMTKRECFAPVPLFGAKTSFFTSHAPRRAPFVALLLPRAARHRQDPIRSESCLPKGKVVCMSSFFAGELFGVFCQDLLKKVPTPPKLFNAFTGITKRECAAPVPLFWAKISFFKPHDFRRAPFVALLLPRAAR